MRTCVALLAATALAACAQADKPCTNCPTADLTANGSATLEVGVGTMIAYAWSSTAADKATSSATMTPSPDGCGNMNGPWVIDTVQGSLPALPLLPCQAGTMYTLELTVTQSSSGETASSSVTIAVAASGSGG